MNNGFNGVGFWEVAVSLDHSCSTLLPTLVSSTLVGWFWFGLWGQMRRGDNGDAVCGGPCIEINVEGQVNFTGSANCSTDVECRYSDHFWRLRLFRASGVSGVSKIVLDIAK